MKRVACSVRLKRGTDFPFDRNLIAWGQATQLSMLNAWSNIGVQVQHLQCFDSVGAIGASMLLMLSNRAGCCCMAIPRMPAPAP